jgi:hypothetical protein
MTDGTGQRTPGAAEAVTLRALADARAGSRSLSDALLTHLPDVGDLATQRLLDAWVEQGADTLRALAETLEERLLDLGSAAAERSGAEPSGGGAPAAHGVDAGGHRRWAP